MNSKVSGMIGLCIKSRNVSMGTDIVKKAIRQNKAKLVLLCNKASDRTKKDMTDICCHYQVDIICEDFSEIFYQLTSKDKMKVMSINNEGFAKQIMNLAQSAE